MHEPPVPSATAEVENPASGTTRIESNDSLELTAPAIGWVLESGEVMVFAVDDLDGRAEGRRRPVAVLVCGEMVVGVPPAVGGQTLVAVALTASRLRSVSSASTSSAGLCSSCSTIWFQRGLLPSWHRCCRYRLHGPSSSCTTRPTR
mgnify:CR=1 FL=1